MKDFVKKKCGLVIPYFTYGCFHGSVDLFMLSQISVQIEREFYL